MFDIFADIIRVFISLFPRLVIVRATHRGIKWKRGKHPVELSPGLHWFWPLVSECETVVVARQTHNMPVQALLTADSKSVSVRGVVVFKINNTVLAYGQKNWDVVGTLNDISQAAVVRVVSRLSLDHLLENLCGSVEKELTEECRRELRPFGIRIQRVAFTDFTTSKMLRLFMPEQGEVQ